MQALDACDASVAAVILDAHWNPRSVTPDEQEKLRLKTFIEENSRDYKLVRRQLMDDGKALAARLADEGTVEKRLALPDPPGEVVCQVLTSVKGHGMITLPIDAAHTPELAWRLETLNTTLEAAHSALLQYFAQLDK